ncbi:MAG TPA: ATP-binding cassette domain-containing protein, partial [Microthrixaceae bacterium]|nr:ATP-binding cassette domain-containing protein [Microthrixaceae bacterium]
SPIQDRPGAIDLIDPKGAIELDDVRFAYPDEPIVASLEEVATVPDAHAPARPVVAVPRPEGLARPPLPLVLDGVSASIEPGQMVALVGQSGAGKTTLSQLVPRLYDVTDGAVRLAGVDVRDATLESVRSRVGVVSQDAHLFHDTLRANLRYARPDATDDELLEVLRAAHILELVERLPDGLDTVVGDRGHRLSGGEKQRLAIARLLLKDPAVVVLDEATAHLDSESEAAVQAALADALEGRTSLVIAHRLATVRDADQILVVDRGRIVERGAHAELLAAGGLYSELVRTQQLGDTTPVPG